MEIAIETLGDVDPIGHEVSVPVAAGFGVRLLGLALLDRADAGPGLLIPRCSSVHTFGMRFALDLHFLDAAEAVLTVHPAVPPRRLIGCRGAAAVLEVPSGGPPPRRARFEPCARLAGSRVSNQETKGD